MSDTNQSADTTCLITQLTDSADSINCISTRISQAKLLCTDSRFLEADSILRTALSLIDSANESEADTFSVDQYMDSILNIYTVMMPPEFLPDNIAMIQFNRQMQMSLDSLIYSSKDSAIISELVSRKDIHFDVPMVWNEKVIKALSYYLRSRPGTINKWLERAAFYLPVMKKMFADSGLPQDLAYLPLIESGFNTQAYSRAHAAGVWQFISSTGKIYGLRHCYWLDERRDPLKSTTSAIRYLKKLYTDFGNWHLALAAYNCGEGGVGRAIEKSGQTDYWQLPLPKETKNYVPCYLAALTIAKNPDLFNFSYDTSKTFAFDTVRISNCIDMRDISDALEINYDEFKKANPHIVHWCTPPDITNVQLYLPAGKIDRFNEYVASIPDSEKVRWYVYKIRRGDNIQSISHRFKVSPDAVREINRLKKNSKIIAGKVLYIPIPAKSDVTQYAQMSSAAQENQTVKKKNKCVSDRSDKVQYKVKHGDTVGKIALLFDVSEGEVEDWNGISGSKIRVGQMLTIYSEKTDPAKNTVSKSSPDTQKYTVADGDTPYSISKKFGISIDELIEMNNLDKNNPLIRIDQVLDVKTSASIAGITIKKSAPPAGDLFQYAVSPGDNLFRIAQNFSITINELMSSNNITENDKIHVGDMLQIPRTRTTFTNNKPLDLSAGIVYYQVKQGDNLWNIAESFGIPVQNLFKVNDLNKDSVLMPGDTIKVVKAGQM